MAVPQPTKLQPQTPLRGNEAISAEISAIDADLAKLKIRFEQHFLGIERKPPTDELDRIRRRVQLLKRSYTQNTALKFRMDTLYQKFLTYEQLWLKTLKEIEDGTYRKDLMRLRLKNLRKARAAAAAPQPQTAPPQKEESQQAEAEQQTAAQAAVPQTAPANNQPAPAGRPKPSMPARPPAPSVLSEARIDEIFCDYIIAKQQCRESTAGITREALARSLHARAGGHDVKVVIKNGKAMLTLVK